jgi:hypothetical protein
VKPVRCVFVRRKNRIRSSQKSGDGILLGARAGRDISRNCIKARKVNKVENNSESKMMGFMKGLSEEDRKRMMACGEKMAAMCSCMNMKEVSEEEKTAMSEKMRSFCGSAMAMMSACFQKEGSRSSPPSASGRSSKGE